MHAQLLVAGVGMVPFRRPGEGDHCDVMAEAAIRAALADARIDHDLVDQAFVGFEQADSGAGARALHRVGIGGIPVASVGNCGSSGSIALFLARQALLAGEAECALAVGFGAACARAETNQSGYRGGAGAVGTGRDRPATGAHELSSARIDWMRRDLGISEEAFAQVAVKSRAHARHNPLALYRDPLTVAAILDESPVLGRLRLSYLCRPGDGAAAVIVCTSRFAVRHGLRQDVALRAQVVVSQLDGEFDEPDAADLLGREMTRRAARGAYALAGVGPEDVDVAEVHDNWVGNEMVSCASLGFCGDDAINAFVLNGENSYGGKVVVGPSGGMLARGHSAGATGLAQIAELTWQLRGEAGGRQVAGARMGLAHDGGQGGSVSVAILQSC